MSSSARGSTLSGDGSSVEVRILAGRDESEQVRQGVDETVATLRQVEAQGAGQP